MDKQLFNEFGVSVQGKYIRVALANRLNGNALLPDQALLFAAWIVALSQPFTETKFDDVLKSVEET